jgi:hypothetical protein
MFEPDINVPLNIDNMPLVPDIIEANDQTTEVQVNFNNESYNWFEPDVHVNLNIANMLQDDRLEINDQTTEVEVNFNNNIQECGECPDVVDEIYETVGPDKIIVRYKIFKEWSEDVKVYIITKIEYEVLVCNGNNSDAVASENNHDAHKT